MPQVRPRSKVRKDKSLERFPMDATVAYKVDVDTLTDDEKAAIKDRRLGYCESHRILYRRPESGTGVTRCIVYVMTGGRKEGLDSCKEWVEDNSWIQPKV